MLELHFELICCRIILIELSTIEGQRVVLTVEATESRLIYEQKEFGMDILGEEAFKGWSNGTLWNGWETPIFEFDEAERLLAALVRAHEQMETPIEAWYDDKEDNFCFILNDQDEPERYPAIVIEIDDKEVKGYGIGAFAWVWEEMSSE